MHPLYVDGLDYDYDFCLLELANPIQFNQYVQPVCLPLSCDDECPEEAEMISAGWGDRNGNTIAIAISPLPLPIAAIALQYSPPYKRADCLMCLWGRTTPQPSRFRDRRFSPGHSAQYTFSPRLYSPRHFGTLNF